MKEANINVISMDDIEYSLFHNYLNIDYIGINANINSIKLLVKQNDENHKVVSLKRKNKFKLEDLISDIENPCEIKLSIIVKNDKHQQVVVGDLVTFIGAKDLIIKDVDLNIKKELLNINILGNGFDVNQYELAYYLLNNNRIINKFMYPQELNINIPLKENGDYYILVFVRNKKTQEKISFKSELIEYELFRDNKKELEKTLYENWKLRNELIHDKEKLYAALEKETNLLISYKRIANELAKVTRKYEGLKHSKLGKLTLKYWQWKKGGVKRV